MNTRRLGGLNGPLTNERLVGRAIAGRRDEELARMKRSTAENVNATAVELTAADLRALDDGFPAGVAAGDRHAPEAMRAVEA